MMFGANIHIVEEKVTFIEQLTTELKNQGKKIYFIPVEASNPIGSNGYENCFYEIQDQEKILGLNFDTIILPLGSGGTYAGLLLGNYKRKANKNIIGFSVSESSEEFTSRIIEILKNSDIEIEDYSSIEINDQFIGEGYAKYTEEEIEQYIEIGKTTGIIFDPCYTGKAFIGMLDSFDKIPRDNILFIHTGGLQGWTKEMREMASKIINENK